jgi:cold shock CspA family protein
MHFTDDRGFGFIAPDAGGARTCSYMRAIW